MEHIHIDVGLREKDNQFFEKVQQELQRARAKFPSPTASTVALGEEYGELCKAILDESWDRVVAEAIQVACMACRVANEGDPSLDSYRISRAQKLVNDQPPAAPLGSQGEAGARTCGVHHPHPDPVCKYCKLAQGEAGKP